MKPGEGVPNERLLRALAEQLKSPLLQIARTAELQDPRQLSMLGYLADTALSLVDGFLLSADQHSQLPLDLEPVSVSSLLIDTAHRLSPLATHHNCDIEIDVRGRYGPAMAHGPSLQSALMLLGYSLIETRRTERRRHRIVLALRRSAQGLVAGVFDNQPGLSAEMLRQGRALHGVARQPMPSFSGGSVAGVFVADSLLQTMAVPLRVARHRSLTGLATTLHPSQQLQLV